uniref:Cadherin domain-containing protein n=1 Tax=Callorhinchus milii TaxID=7868 RepID=A0A4W3HW97_CALMI
MLDREKRASYALIIQAKDNGSKSKTGTAVVIISVLDINDNAPRFPQIFLAHVPENAPVGFIIVRMTITDEDIGVNAISTYSILDQTTKLPFAIDQNTGDLTVAKLLDRETTDQYIIRVHANDSAWSVNTDVTLLVTDANDNEPRFTEPFYIVTIPEPKEKEVFILQVSATDPDLNQNGQVFYLLKFPNEFFGINATTGEIFTKHVIASDRGEPANQCETTVMVTIVSRNDYPPMFLSHRNITPVPLNLTFGTKVIKLTATDKDFITVTATDKGMPSLSSGVKANFLITEENKFAPKFSTLEMTFSIPEDQAPGFVIGRLTASDNDQGVNGLIKYSIASGNDKGYFTVGNTTGLLSLVESLDFEMDSFHVLQIYGQDAGWISKTGSLNVLVQVEDVNDNPPRFCNTIFFATVAENSPCGTEVLKLNATDVDTGLNAEINFSIDDGHTDMFAVDQQSGIITVQEILDFEMLQFYEITVRAFNLHDTDHFSLAKVYINVTGENEYLPQFSKAHYNFAISEIAPKGTIVGYVTATDRDLGCDGIVNYLLVANSKKRGFKIDGNTGVIVVSDNTKLCGGSFTLLHVLAKNAGIIYGFDVDEALINITLLDVNNPPVFKSSIYQTHIREDVLVGTSVITLMAEDSDTVPEWNQLLIEIEDGNTNQSFSINPNSGVVLVASPLDRETLPVYNITIIAFDSGQTPATGSTQLVIIVDDVNDNGPILVTTKGYVTENQPPGREILALNATDLDLPPNQGPFTYQLAHEDSRSFFTLSPMGVLTTKKLIDREHITELYLPVMVQDSGTPPMSSMGTVHILVLDQNDNPSQPRNLYIQVNYYGKYYPGGNHPLAINMSSLFPVLAFLNIYI